MKILLIYPEIKTYHYSFHFGLGYLASILKSNGFQVSLLHLTREPSKEELINRIFEIHPKLIGITLLENQYIYVKKIISWIKTSMDIPIICGGVFSILCPDEVIKNTLTDMVCICEGEFVILELAKRISEDKPFDDIPGLWLRENSTIIKNPKPEPIKNLDLLPHPDRDIFEYDKILRFFNYTAAFIITRGCPFGCYYCCNESIQKAMGSNMVRFRSVGNVIDEIKDVLYRYKKIKHIVFDDDTFTFNREYMENFLMEYKKEINLPYTIQTRVEMIEEDIIRFLKATGCHRIVFGVESGSEHVRRKYLNRYMKNTEIKKAFELANKFGIRTFANNMIGIPGETKEDIEASLKLNQKIIPWNGTITFFYPYRGTPLYNYCKNHRLLSDKFSTSYFNPFSVVNNLDVPPRDLERHFYKFKYLIMILSWRREKKLLYFLHMIIHPFVKLFLSKEFIGRLKFKFDNLYIKLRLKIIKPSM